MAGIHIHGTGSAVPEKIMTNEDLSNILDTSDEWIFSRTGIKKRHIKNENEAVHVFAVKAAKEAIESAKKRDPDFSENKIKLIITATMTSDYVFPSVSCIVQKELGLSLEAAAFDISAACTGFVYALQSAYGILGTSQNGYALIIGAECMSTVLDYSDRSSCVLFGDGAGAAVISFDGSEKSLFASVAGTQGDTEILYCLRKPKGDGYLHMKGGTVYSFAATTLKKAIEELLKKSGLSMNEIDMVVCHQANSRIIDSVKKKYPGHEHKFFKNMDEYANTSAASVAIAIDDLYKRDILKKEMKIITAAFGAGLSWNGIILTI